MGTHPPYFSYVEIETNRRLHPSPYRGLLSRPSSRHSQYLESRDPLRRPLTPSLQVKFVHNLFLLFVGVSDFSSGLLPSSRTGT